MKPLILDSGILIRHLRNRPGYPELVDRLTDEGDIYIASITRLEIIRGMRDHEAGATFDLLDSMITVPLDTRIADLAGELIRSWRKKGSQLDDADTVIAATALSLSISLVTTNPRHFPMPGLTIWQADEEGNLSQR